MRWKSAKPGHDTCNQHTQSALIIQCKPHDIPNGSRARTPACLCTLWKRDICTTPVATAAAIATIATGRTACAANGSVATVNPTITTCAAAVATDLAPTAACAVL
jgi:hypothetical protein